MDPVRYTVSNGVEEWRLVPKGLYGCHGCKPVVTGFTFVELLIAATMMSVLFVGLSAHLRGGIMVWRQVTATGESLQRQRVTLERLERDLANAFLYDERGGAPPAPDFGSSSMRWFTVQPGSRLSPTAVRVVAYGCRAVDGTPWLWRTAQSVGEVLAGREPSLELLMPGCDALSIRYAYRPPEGAGHTSDALEWLPRWDEGDAHQLPRLVSVSLRFGPGQYPHALLGAAWVRAPQKTIQRVFSVPAGVLKARET